MLYALSMQSVTGSECPFGEREVVIVIVSKGHIGYPISHFVIYTRISLNSQRKETRFNL